MEAPDKPQEMGEPEDMAAADVQGANMDWEAQLEEVLSQDGNYDGNGPDGSLAAQPRSTSAEQPRGTSATEEGTTEPAPEASTSAALGPPAPPGDVEAAPAQAQVSSEADARLDAAEEAYLQEVIAGKASSRGGAAPKPAPPPPVGDPPAALPLPPAQPPPLQAADKPRTAPPAPSLPTAPPPSRNGHTRPAPAGAAAPSPAAQLLAPVQALEAQLQQLLQEDAKRSSPAAAAVAERLVRAYNTTSVQLMKLRQEDAAYELLQKAELVCEGEGIFPYTARVQKYMLLGVTYNNMACYFKTQRKEHAAVMLLKKAVAVEEQSEVADNPAGTYLNLCAALSAIGKHEEALANVEQAIEVMFSRLGVQLKQEQAAAEGKTMVDDDAAGKQRQEQPTPAEREAARQEAAKAKGLTREQANVLAAAYHNKGAELQHLQRYDEGDAAFDAAVAFAMLHDTDLASHLQALRPRKHDEPAAGARRPGTTTGKLSRPATAAKYVQPGSNTKLAQAQRAYAQSEGKQTRPGSAAVPLAVDVAGEGVGVKQRQPPGRSSAKSRPSTTSGTRPGSPPKQLRSPHPPAAELSATASSGRLSTRQPPSVSAVGEVYLRAFSGRSSQGGSARRPDGGAEHAQGDEGGSLKQQQLAAQEAQLLQQLSEVRRQKAAAEPAAPAAAGGTSGLEARPPWQERFPFPECPPSPPWRGSLSPQPSAKLSPQASAKGRSSATQVDAGSGGKQRQSARSKQAGGVSAGGAGPRVSSPGRSYSPPARFRGPLAGKARAQLAPAEASSAPGAAAPPPNGGLSEAEQEEASVKHVFARYATGGSKTMPNRFFGDLMSDLLGQEVLQEQVDSCLRQLDPQRTGRVHLDDLLVWWHL